MTIDEAKAAKAAWRERLNQALREFKDDTGLTVELLDEVAARPLLLDRDLIALAQPEPEVVEPTDEELDAWITECADATRYGPLEHYWAFDVQFDHVRDIAHATLARWGRPTLAPAEGEVTELVALIRQIALAWEPDACLLGNMTAGQLARAADLLERQAAPVPVAVSERLPGDALCWWFEPDEEDEVYGSRWTLLRIRGNASGFTHWLPAHALPLPVATPAGQEGA